MSTPVHGEQPYQTIFEASSDGLAVNDLGSGLLLAANPAFCQMHGYDQMVGMHPYAFIPPEERYLFDEFAQTIRQGREFRVRGRHLRRDGSVFDVEVLGRGIVYQGQPAMLGVVRDITEQAHAYRELEQRVAERTAEIERRSAVAEGLRDLLAVVNSGRTLDEILSYVVDQGRQLLGSDGSAIFVPDGSGEQLVARAINGYVRNDAHKIPVGMMATGLAYARRWPMANPDVTPVPAEQRDFQRELELEEHASYSRIVHMPASLLALSDERAPFFGAYAVGYRAILAVPLLARGEIYGTLTLYYRESREFKDDEVDLAMAFAGQAGLAIENANLRAREEQRRHELELLYHADEVLHRSLRLEDVLWALVQVATDLLATTHVAVVLWDEHGRQVVANSEVREAVDAALPPEEAELLREQLWAGPMAAGDARADPRLPPRLRAFHARAGVASTLLAPIWIGGQVAGVFGASYMERRSFGAAEQRLLQALGQRAALAIENASLYRQSQERAAEIERRRAVAECLRDLLAVVNSGRNLDQILEYVVGQSGRVLGSDACAIYVPLEADGRQVFGVRAASGLDDEYAALRVPHDFSATGMAFAQRRAVATPDVVSSLQPAATPDWGLELEERGSHTSILRMPKREQLPASEMERRLHRMGAFAAGYRSLLAVPLTIGDEAYGTLTLYYREPRQYSDDEVELATAFADQAALAIENARLREQAQQAATLEERQRLARELHDAVTQTLFSASLIAEVVPDLWDSKPDEARRRLEQLRRLTRGALAEMRSLLVELRPGALTEMPLGELLRQLAEATSGRTRLAVTLEVEQQDDADVPQLPPEVQVTLYRVAQEALNNIAKHAQASQVGITLYYAPDGGVTLRVVDDGQGFDPAAIQAGHLGVGIMRERAVEIGAELRVVSRPGLGTRVEIHWPGRGEAGAVGHLAGESARANEPAGSE